ncbi:putative N-acyl-phosphatidylethanolamine-hydrolyzing phospholipase D isoform X3 [Apostichopus japonicus]|uniref:Putative N-acyl-phosphatidylethanolamine-hydrolyzing phospholipase D isoform X3 n=1 Tax=Stichopus japonicus TaxID=307972 RepID=A0A2G8JT95_STIJA|nr:putative N-acyl-phosphatidylethanolamine-hydrolyzing phospholipase D isoform X3 [Apostichopus japonicus]
MTSLSHMLKMSSEDDENTSLMQDQNLVQFRTGWLWYKNPEKWKFSLFNVFHIFKNICSYLKYFLFHKASKPNSAELNEHLPESDRITLEWFRKPPEKGIQVLWIGHASLLVRIDGINILTDPVFYDCGPRFCGCRIFNYKRFRPPAVTVKDLKDVNIQIHAVVISHDHFDHLDEQSVSELVAYKTEIEWYVPKNMSRWFKDRNCTNVTELGWWEERTSTGNLTVACTPAKHWCGRNLRYLYCRHLWCSWYIVGPRGSKFLSFAGDTGMLKDSTPQLRISMGHQTLQLSRLVHANQVMQAQHINPEEALIVHRELDAKNSIAIHWGMFALSNEKINEPIEDLQKAKRENGDETFFTMKHGEVKWFETNEADESS